MFRIKLLLIWVWLAGVASCKNSLSPYEYINEINGNKELNKEYLDEVFHLTCSYKPSEYVALLELRNELEQNQNIPPEQFASVWTTFDNSVYFILTIGLNDSTDIMRYGIRNANQYNERINGITFNMNRSAYVLTDQNDTIRAVLNDYQRNYGMSPNATIMFAFPKERIEQSKEADFVYEDSYFGITMPVHLTFSTSKLFKSIPKLNINHNE